MRITIKSFWPAIGMLLLATILFCVPGNELPDEDWLGKINADKLVHIGLFAALVGLWGLPIVAKVPRDVHRSSAKRVLFYVVAAAIVYGIAIELIQGAYIPNRSYSVADMVADGIGSVMGGLFVSRQYQAREHQ
ncbi:MAG TPA: VanZ family protein [Chryseolinea sp.]|nr:VanZ family protein [Chryseolinea sp.]